MPQSLVQIYVHFVFSTKHRTPWLKDTEQRSRLHAYIAGICHNLDSPSLITGGVADHVHVLIRYGKGITIPDLVREMKRDSTKWVKAELTNLGDFHWQEGYAAFSVSPSHVEPLKQYIANQEEHHKTETYQDELRRIFRKYEVVWDERYVWD